MHDFGRRTPRLLSNWFAAMVRLNRLGFKARPLMLSNGRVYLQVEPFDAMTVSYDSTRRGSGSRRPWLVACIAFFIVTALIAGLLLLHHRSPPARLNEAANTATTSESDSLSSPKIQCQPVLGQTLTEFLDAHPSVRVDSDIVLGQLRAVKVSGECGGAGLATELYLSADRDGWLIEKVTQPFDRVTSSNAN